MELKNRQVNRRVFMMENTNEMTIIFDSRPVNEALARVAVASFCTQLNPTLEEISDLKNRSIGGSDQLHHTRV